MRIDKSNATIINSESIYIHDDELILLQFDRNTNILTLFLKQSWPNEFEYTIEFIKVIGFEITSCDFWGKSECVLDFEFIEPDKQSIIPKLSEKWLSVEKDNRNDSLIENKFETIITFSSGDTLIISCEYIQFNKAHLSEVGQV